jgi:hypothetical protein
MPTLASPADASPTRPAFRDGQTLRADDLRAEADDRVRAARRHQANAHRPGVVAGLWLQSNGSDLSISPGAAIDGIGRMILVPDGAGPRPLPDQLPAEVWLAYREDPADADDPATPDGPPDRYTEQFDVLFLPPWQLDPADPRSPVFLGTILENKQPSHAGRVYVGAVGARVEAASRQVRLLLGPDGPGDFRVYALASRDSESDPYADHLAIDTAGTVTLAVPSTVDFVSVQTGNAQDHLPVVIVGDRPPTFTAADICDPFAVVVRWKLSAFDSVLSHCVERELIPTDLGPDAKDRLAATVARVLNRIIDDVPSSPDRPVTQAAQATSQPPTTAPSPTTPTPPPRTDQLADAVRQSGASLRIGAIRQLLERAAGSPRADERLLRRLLLEDAFPGLVAQFTMADPGPVRGVSFVGVAPPPAAARPGGFYLAEVTDKTGTHRELRIEFRNPGKDQHPERYKVSIGTVPPDPCTGQAANFSATLTVDASGTVTIPGNLNVFTQVGSTSPGLILKVAPTTDPNDPATKAAQLGQVSPDDLLIHKPLLPAISGDVVQISTAAELINTGQAPMQGVQLHAVLFPTNDTDREPITVPLLRGLTLNPGERAALVSPADGKSPLEVPLRSGDPDGPDFSNLPAHTSLTLILKAIGAGPGNVIAEVSRRVVFKNN